MTSAKYIEIATKSRRPLSYNGPLAVDYSMSNNTSVSQSDVQSALPNEANNLAERFGISTSTVRGHIRRLRKNGVAIECVDGVYHEMERPNNEVTTPVRASKQSQSKEANNHLVALNDRLETMLEGTQPPVADGGLACTESGEDVVLHRSDEHIGTALEDEFGNEIMSTEIAAERIREVTRQTVEEVKHRRELGHEFDTLHCLYGGDTVTGENIFNHQPHEIDATLDKQIDLGVELLFEQVASLAPHFKSVQVVTQPGNHGELRADGMSEMANADRIVYGFLDKLIRMSDHENITMIRNQSTNFTNFRMRVDREQDQRTAEALDVPLDELEQEYLSGHHGHLRHGQDSLEHIGTSAGKNRWRGWQIQHGFDAAYRGHYHEFKIEHVLNKPVLMSGSICPPDDYEESLSEWSEPAATIHGVSDENTLEWIQPVRFN